MANLYLDLKVSYIGVGVRNLLREYFATVVS